MRALVLESRGKVQLCEIPEPKPKEREVLVKVDQAAICGSDIALFTGKREGKYPLILGHEGIGHIIDIGSEVDSSVLGSRVVFEPNIPCGTCPTCIGGNSVVCPQIKRIGIDTPGCFAGIVSIDVDYAWEIPEKVHWRNAVTIEPFGVSVKALRTAEVFPGDSLLIIGCGNEGLLMTMLGAETGINVSVVDKNPKRLKLAQKYGAINTYLPEELNGKSELSLAVIEAAGVPSTVELAFRLAKRGGCITLVGLSTEQAKLVPMDFIKKDLRIKSSLAYDHVKDFPRAVNLVSSGRFSPGIIVEDSVPFEEAINVLEKSSSGLYGKFVLDLNTDF